jgi:hypothetical protein
MNAQNIKARCYSGVQILFILLLTLICAVGRRHNPVSLDSKGASLVPQHIQPSGTPHSKCFLSCCVLLNVTPVLKTLSKKEKNFSEISEMAFDIDVHWLYNRCLLWITPCGEAKNISMHFYNCLLIPIVVRNASNRRINIKEEKCSSSSVLSLSLSLSFFYSQTIFIEQNFKSI